MNLRYYVDKVVFLIFIYIVYECINIIRWGRWLSKDNFICLILCEIFYIDI